MQLSGQESRLRFELMSVENGAFPALGFDIEARSGAFSGEVKEVWFARHDLETFVLQLTDFERSRQGEVHLEAVGKESEYCSFRLRLFTLDNVGQVAVSTELVQTRYMGRVARLSACVLKLTFEVDTGSLTDFISSCHQVVQSSKS